MISLAWLSRLLVYFHPFGLIIIWPLSTQAFAGWGTVLSSLSRAQRLSMLNLSSVLIGEDLGHLGDFGLYDMMENYVVPVHRGSRRCYLDSAPHRQIIQVRNINIILVSVYSQIPI